ncbi:hypothetical protein [Trichormus variabilis]|uniref:hypothetical protein n=1 Tax=Anabaena variabilis TaxID=264691 RepID=UPI001F548548|nr:hypothetical protein [Trichormus variabilis]
MYAKIQILIINLLTAELEFMQKCNASATLANILAQVELDLDGVRHLLKQQLLLLTPAS